MGKLTQPRLQAVQTDCRIASRRTEEDGWEDKHDPLLLSGLLVWLDMLVWPCSLATVVSFDHEVGRVEGVQVVCVVSAVQVRYVGVGSLAYGVA